MFKLDFEFGSTIRSLLSTVPVFVVWSVLEYLRDRYMPSLFAILPVAYNIQSLFTLAVSFVIVFLLFTVLNMKRVPTGLQAFVFFPKDTPEQDKTLQFSETNHYPKIIVNFKIIPPVAYPMPSGSYAWTFVQKHRDSWVAESAKSLKNPRFVETWSKEHGYVLIQRTASRDELSYGGYYNIGKELDERLAHVEYRYFYAPWHRLFPPKPYPSKRCILNWSTRKAWALDSQTEHETVGKIRGRTEFWWPRRHYVQKWARQNGFDWSEQLPTMKDLLATRRKKSK